MCKCGCGERTNWIVSQAQWGTWRKGHHMRKHGDPANWNAVQAKRDEHMSRVYGLTPADYHAMLEAQCGGCAICFEDRPQRGRTRMIIDHNHTTGKIRGLLCAECNTALGLFKDSAILLRAAAKYLEGKLN